ITTGDMMGTITGQKFKKADGYYSEAEGKWVKYNYDPNKGQIITPESAKKWEEAAKNDEFNKR
ncbi:MAG: hypothetical protein HUK28_03630, partial [Methanobrevibacter sp.]|nr:hypothetical protein [Methanobrevibacter sp.]